MYHLTCEYILFSINYALFHHRHLYFENFSRYFLLSKFLKFKAIQEITCKHSFLSCQLQV